MSTVLTGADAGEYLVALKGLLAFHVAVGNFSRRTVANELGPHAALLTRTRALRSDIRLMSAKVPATDGARAEGRSADHPADIANRLSGGREERVGAAYVAAGSALGGRILVAGLAAGGADFPRTFLAGNGLDVGRLWRRFTTALNIFGDSGVDITRVVAGAVAAFQLVSDILDWSDTADRS